MKEDKTNESAKFMSNEQLKSAEFKILMDYAKDMHHRHHKALYAFYAYEALREIDIPSVVGKSEAEENRKTIGKYKLFFIPVQEALRVYFFLELAKLFDVSNRSLHINKAVNFTESNITQLTVEAFEEYNKNQDRAFLEELVRGYRGVNHSDLMEMRSMLNTHKKALKKLKTYRDKWLVHEDISKPELPDINKGELRSMFSIIAKILNLITNQLNRETWMCSHIESDVKDHVKLVVDHLRRFEPYRLKEIESKYQEKLKSYGIEKEYSDDIKNLDSKFINDKK